MNEANEKDGSLDIPVRPVFTDQSKSGFRYPYKDYYCPRCNNLAAYDAVGKRRIARGDVMTRCRVCNQLIDWSE